MAPNSKKRKASELDNGDTQSTKLANGHPSPSTEPHQQTPPLIGLDATEVPFKLTCPAKHVKLKKTKGGKQPDIFGPQDEDGDYPQLNIQYMVKPGSKWSELKPYRNFIVQEQKFSLGSHVYISHPQSPKITSDYKFVASADKSEPDFWVAKVLEVRASDQQHVYLRVFWLYWPDELPGGRRDYHGQNEVLMSNHMDIIDAMTVSGGADVRMWHERDEDDDLGSIFFRQFFNLTTKEPLSELRRHCICNQYYNPDTTLLKCNNSTCGIWLHEKCLLDDILRKTYKRRVIEGKDDNKEKTPEPKLKQEPAPGTPKSSIFGSAGHLGDMLAHPLRSLKASMSPAPESKTEPDTEVVNVADTTFTLTKAPAATSTPKTNGKANGKTPSKATPKSQSRKSKGRSKSLGVTEDADGAKDEVDIETIKKSFDARIETSDPTGEKGEGSSPSTVKVIIEDKRPGKNGNTWTEDVFCLKCKSQLD